MPVIEVLIVGIVLIVLVIVVKVVRTDPYDKGENAYLDGLSKYDNPYSKFTQKAKSKEWNEGWKNAKERNGNRDNRYWA